MGIIKSSYLPSVFFSILFLMIISLNLAYADTSGSLNFRHTFGDVHVDSTKNRIYVSTSGTSQGFEGIIIIDGRTDKVIDQIKMSEKDIWSFAINPNTNLLYVGYAQTLIKPGSDPYDRNKFEKVNAIDIIDISSKEVISIEIPDSPPADIVINSNTNDVYVASSSNSILLVLDGTTHYVTKQIPLQNYPGSISINHDTNSIYVAINSREADTDEIYVIDENTLEIKDVIHAGIAHRDIETNPNLNLIYVSNLVSNVNDFGTISVIDGETNSVINEISAKRPYTIHVNSNNNLIYFFDSESRSLSAIDGVSNELIGTFDSGHWSSGFDVNDVTGKVYVASGDSFSVLDEKLSKINDEELIRYKSQPLPKYFDAIWHEFPIEILIGLTFIPAGVFVHRISKKNHVDFIPVKSAKRGYQIASIVLSGLGLAYVLWYLINDVTSASSSLANPVNSMYESVIVTDWQVFDQFFKMPILYGILLYKSFRHNNLVLFGMLIIGISIIAFFSSQIPYIPIDMMIFAPLLITPGFISLGRGLKVMSESKTLQNSPEKQKELDE